MRSKNIVGNSNQNKNASGKNTIALNPEQQEAANTLDGPVKIVAGAGTGKTRVLTQRYMNLVKEGKARAENILCVTFTNKAANEMFDRVAREGVPIIKHLSWIVTFHRFGSKVLREHSNRISKSGRFEIVDTSDSAAIINDIVAQNHIATFLRAKRILRDISRAKDDYITPEEFRISSSVSNQYQDHLEYEQIGTIYSLYQKYLDANGYFDFGDLLCKTIDLFEQHPDVLTKYQEQLKYIQIDEYQDTNLAQHMLSMKLGEKYKNVCVVGDPDQTIYTWRGARYENLAEFDKEMGSVKTITLEQNYRSHPHILNFANNLISHNEYREEKNLWSKIALGNQVSLKAAYDQPSFISQKIDELIASGDYEYQDICVLYRNNNLSGAIETELLQSSIPYATRDTAFYQRAEIKDSIAYLKVLADPENDIQLLRITNTPRRAIGKRAMETLSQQAQENNCSLFETMKNASEISALSAQAKKGCLSFTASIEEVIAEIKKEYEDLESPEAFSLALELLFEKIGYMEHLQKIDQKENDRGGDGDSSRCENVISLIELCKNTENLTSFLEAVALDTETSEADDNAPKNRVSLMTIHRAKGLEYPVVFVTNMNGYTFPRNIDDPIELEEERRLAYVAFTRAESELFLTWAQDYPPSIFVQEACFGNDDCYKMEY